MCALVKCAQSILSLAWRLRPFFLTLRSSRGPHEIISQVLVRAGSLILSEYGDVVLHLIHIRPGLLLRWLHTFIISFWFW